MSAAPVSPRPESPLARFMTRLGREWLPGIAWRLGHTGRVGLVGVGLIAASGIFYVSTHLPVVREVTALRADLEAARTQGGRRPVKAVGPESHLPALSGRNGMPDLLGVILEKATDAHLELDAGKYDVTTSKLGRITRYKVSLPVIGPYPQVRQFLDATLGALPAATISELSLERKSVADPVVEAQVRLSVFTRSEP